uniref:OSJNBa0013A04.19 protein n=1 Tax=Oryza sativa subsp. japonica TaxID=39947 RepID=Q7XLF0_ORYSJ|nr:OSJNBa0013A04.19 [Oryza sativa Japonica Group]
MTISICNMIRIGEGMEADSRDNISPPAKKSRKAHSSPALHETRKKAAGRGRGKGKLQASLLDPKKLDLGKVPSLTPAKPAPTTFQLGMPLVGDNELTKMGPTCRELHGYYMEMSNARRKNRETSMIGWHGTQPFLGPEAYIVVDFEDLFELYSLRAVDTTHLKCYSL